MGISELTQKTKEGAEWRGEISVKRGEDDIDLTIRQLRDPEFEEVMELIDRDELKEFREHLPVELMEEYEELSQMDDDDMSEADEARLEEIEEEMEEVSADIDLFEIFSTETFEGLRTCAKYAIEPSQEEMEEALRTRASEIEEKYGVRVQQPEDTRIAFKDDIEYSIDNATDFSSVTIGLRALTETVGERGN